MYKLGVTFKLLPVLGISVIYALCYTAIKFGLAYSPPLIFGGMRAFFGGLALLGILIVLRQPFFPGHRDWGVIFLIGLVSTTLNFGAMFLSPGFTGAGIASVLGNLQPLIALILAALFLGERMTIPKIAALVLGSAGVTLIAFPAISGTSRYGINGSLLALSVSVSSAAGSILVKHLIQKGNFLIIAAWQLIIGSLPLLAISVLIEPVNKIKWSLTFIGVLLFLALVGTSLVTAVWYWLLQKQEVGYLTLFLFLTPLFGLGIAALVFNERLNLLASVGVILILAGIGIVISRKPG
jgi:drug/metabolite transporter (DMT)-like permease